MARATVPTNPTTAIPEISALVTISRRRMRSLLAETTPRTVLDAASPRKVLVRPGNGERQYAYADPTGCRCLYVGTEQNYQELRNLQQQARMAAESAHAVETRAAFEDLWRGVWPPPLQ